jgi:sarcosine oxidase subunit beta
VPVQLRPWTRPRIAIVGAGIIGASIAYHLAESGDFDIAIYERGRPGEGATAAATGGIRQQFSEPVNISLCKESVCFYAAFRDRVGYPLDFRQNGYLFLTSDTGKAARLQESVRLQQAMGVEAELVAAGDIASIAPPVACADIIAASYCPSDGVASPSDACAGLLAAAKRNGARLRAGTPVIGLQARGDAVCGVITPAGTEPCDIVVNAAGPYAAEIGDMLRIQIPVTPSHRQVCLVERPPGVPPGIPLTVDLDTGAYFHAELSGLLLGGTDHHDFRGHDTTPDWDLVPQLIESVARRLPDVADCGIKRLWAGEREMTPDETGIVAFADEVSGFLVAAGFSGHGFMQAPAIGRIAASLIRGEQVPGYDLGRLGMRRFRSRQHNADRAESQIF